MSYDIAVVGGGPAGLSAAVQARQRGKSVVIISGDDRDGPLWKTERIDNYLGFYQSTGPELLGRFRTHADAMGVERVAGRALNIMPMKGKFYLSVGTDVVEAGAVVIAAGVSHGTKFPGEAELLGKGLSYCATCDGMLYRGREVTVIGKSAEAPKEANFLQEIGCRVTYLAGQRPETLSADIAFLKAGKLAFSTADSGLLVRSEGREIPCAGIFVLRAAVAPTDLLPGLKLSGAYVEVDRSMSTSVPGVFAAGDCTGLPHQVSKAVGEGQVAGHRAAEYVDRNK